MSKHVEASESKGLKKSLLAVALLAAALLLAAPGLVMAYPGAGGGGGGGQPGMGTEAAPQEFDESTLQSFAVASVQLQNIQEEYAQRLEGVQDEEKAIELQRQANEEMVATVEEAGIDVQSYNAIANEMNTSPELHARVMEMIEQEQNR